MGSDDTQSQQLNGLLAAPANQSGSEAVQLQNFYIGLTLALLSSFFIGSSFILKKKGLLKLVASSSPISNDQYSSNTKAPLRAGQGGYGYLKEWLWWTGLLTMGVGELCNFAAYGFVPATLVTPLGALSVLISAIMAAYFLNEKLNTIGKVGCLLTAIGSTMMVIHAPKEGEVKSMADLLYKLQDAEFVLFTILSIVSLFILIFYFVPRYGNTNVLIYILICSILGSFTVMSCKGLSLGIKEMFNHKPSASYIYTFMFAFVVIACIMIQMNYLNKSLDIFNTPIVTTVYYVLFTLFVMIASTLLFKELLNVSFQDFVGCVCGFTTIICALCLIHFFKTTNDQESASSTLSNALSSKFNSESEHNHNDHLQSGLSTGDQDSETSSYRDLNFKAYLANERVDKSAYNAQQSHNAINSERAFFSSSFAASPNDDLTRRSGAYQQGESGAGKVASYTQETESVILSCPPLPANTSSNTNFTFLKKLAQQYKPIGRNILNFASNVTNRSPGSSSHENYNYYKLATNETDSMGNEEDLYSDRGSRIVSSSIPANAARSPNAQSKPTTTDSLFKNNRASKRDNEPSLLPNGKGNGGDHYTELNINDDDDDDADENVEFNMAAESKAKLLNKNNRNKLAKSASGKSLHLYS